MKNPKNRYAAYAVAAVIAGSNALAESPLVPFTATTTPTRPARPQPRRMPVTHALIEASAAEPATSTVANVGFNTKSAFSASTVPSPQASLSPPVTLTYSGGSPVLEINDSGTNKGVLSQITNSHNSTSALYGVTNGSGAGLTGYNSGTAGPAGKFGITNADSSQPAVSSTTNGFGPALLGSITNVKSEEPAILGQHAGAAFGTGVEGQGGSFGVYGISHYVGTFGSGDAFGVLAQTSSGTALYADSGSGEGLYAHGGGSYAASFESDSGVGAFSFSSSNYAVAAESDTGTALIATADKGGTGIEVKSNTGIGILTTSSGGNAAMKAQSTNSYAVIGEDLGNGTGVYGYSAGGFAGYFDGIVYATGYQSASDRNLKTQIQPVDGKTILDKVNNLPVSSWFFKNDLRKNHVGPMAQDFHAAFGLDGEDDKHINLNDIAGVSLAAIQQLSKEVQAKDAQIAALEQRLSAQAKAIEQMESITGAIVAHITSLEQSQQTAVVSTVSSSLDN